MAGKAFVRTATLQQSQAIVDKDGRPAAWFVRLINDNNGNVVEAVNRIAVLPAIQQALADAQQAAADATAAAASANDAAQAAQDQTDATKREAALQGSYIEPASVLSASPTTITVAAHTRMYADGMSAPVSGGTIAATASGDTDYISYVDPERVGGTVTFQVSTSPPVQTGDTHVVGAVDIPTTGTVDGGEGPRRPGYVTSKFLSQPEE
jgi:multidrug efflux pump subunit AcrA (membrane-fusion protein)